MKDSLAHYRDVARRITTGEAVTFEEIETILVDFDSGVYGDVPKDDSVTDVVLDCFEAISELERDDGALFWNHGHRLASLGRHREAAAMFIRASALIEQDAHAGTGDLDDEADWAQSALYHAVKQLVEAQRPLTGAIVAQRIEDADLKDEVVALLGDELARA